MAHPRTFAPALALAATVALSVAEYRSLHLHRDLSLVVQGRMATDAHCQRETFRGREQHTLLVAYHYRVDGAAFYGNRYSVWNGRVSQADCEALARSLKAGTPVAVTADRDAPQFSVLDPTRHARIMLVTVPLAVCAAVYLLFAALAGRTAVATQGEQAP